jgi:hypothetical protein
MGVDLSPPSFLYYGIVRVPSLKDFGNSFFSLALACTAGHSKKLIAKIFKLGTLWMLIFQRQEYVSMNTMIYFKIFLWTFLIAVINILKSKSENINAEAIEYF